MVNWAAEQEGIKLHLKTEGGAIRSLHNRGILIGTYEKDVRESSIVSRSVPHMTLHVVVIVACYILLHTQPSNM